MTSNNFFSFDSKLSSSTMQVSTNDLTINCSNLIKGDYQNINFPITFIQEYGYKLRDVLDTGWAGFHLISENMRFILEENKLTGWKVFPIKIYDKKGNEIVGYHGFSVTGRCGPVSFDNSKIIEKRLIPEGPLCKYYKGIFVDNWDGTDFFTPDAKYHTFITENVVEIFRKRKLTNILIEKLADYEVDVSFITKD